mgnify:CR=1 FL=1
MKLGEAIKLIVKENNTSYERMAKRLGLKIAGSIFNIISRNDCKVSFLYRICDEYEYDGTTTNDETRVYPRIKQETM